jgi:uncharacterized membrane protein
MSEQQQNSEQPANQFSIRLVKDNYPTDGGSRLHIPVFIHNQAAEERAFFVRVDGLPAEWLPTPLQVIELEADSEHEHLITIRVPKTPESKPGMYEALIRVGLQENPAETLETPCRLTVAGSSIPGNPLVLLESTDFSTAPGESLAVRLVLVNQLDEADTVEVSIDGIPAEWTPTVATSVTLQGGEQREIVFHIQPDEQTLKGVGRYPFSISVFSQSNPQDSRSAEMTLTIAAVEVMGRIGLLMQQNQFSVAPGKQVLIPVVVINQGLSEDSFELKVEGIPVNWVFTNRPVLRLKPGEQAQANLTVQPPLNYQSKAGRHGLRIIATSQQAPDQFSSIDCTLTIGVFQRFASELRPQEVEAGEQAQVLVQNQGNVQQTYNVYLQSVEEEINFAPSPSASLRVPPGELGMVGFTAAPATRPILGGAYSFPFSVLVQSAEKDQQTHQGQVIGRALIPIWVLPLVVVFCLGLFCITTWLVTSRLRPDPEAGTATQTAAAVTQTASANQTAAAILGESDSDGDGLTNREEGEIGTDPLNPDTDGDRLLDGPEVKQHGTDPLNPDSDGDVLGDSDELERGTDPLRPDTDSDGLGDGDEVNRGTDPLNPDSDSDGLNDGDEVNRGTDPLNQDSDDDQLNDGQEVQIGTDPLNPDTDNDRLKDGEESPPCPDPRNPDTDGDGIIDGLDPDPCDPTNPSITASAPVPSPTTNPPTAQPTIDPTLSPVVPDLGPGAVSYATNRDGNQEIYVMDTQSFAEFRLTNDPAADTQPTWSPDGSKIAFASNRTGNFEIYIMNADGSGVSNLTNFELADDLYPTWSPDGNWIAFSTNRDGNQEIYSVKVDGSGLVNLTNSPTSNDLMPDWFKSGGILFGSEFILFTSNRDGNQEIYRMKSDGSDLVRLTASPSNDSQAKGSAGGNWVVYTTDRDGNQEVYRMNVDGSNQTNLSRNPAQDVTPDWSANEQWIVFVSTRDGQPDVYVMRNDGNSPYNMTKSTSEDLQPSWR